MTFSNFVSLEYVSLILRLRGGLGTFQVINIIV